MFKRFFKSRGSNATANVDPGGSSPDRKENPTTELLTSAKISPEKVEFALEFVDMLATLETNLHASDDPEEISHGAMKMACDFYQADWCGFLMVDLDLGLWTPYWWYNTNSQDRTEILTDEYESAAKLPRWIAAMQDNTKVMLRDVNAIKDEAPEEYPIVALEMRWPHQSAPGHRDVLGSVMGLGIKRSCIGDIVLEAERGYLFAERQMADHIARSLVSAGRIRLQVEPIEGLPQLEPPKGVEKHDTVSSMRLDAVIAAGLNLSRGDAAELITAGHVKLRHLPTERTDARVQEGDAISVRGHGRLVVEEVGNPTKKGRLPLRLIRYGTK